MAPSEEVMHSWSAPDVACTRCRERKIRCGRERRQCANCKRDGVDCEYTPAGKRVNHVKLLCNNVAGLEGRLINIEGELSRLATYFKAVGSQRSSVDMTAEEELPSPFISDDQLSEDSPSLLPKDRHVVRGQVDLTDRYHGPGTLFTLCNSFRDIAVSERGKQKPPPTENGSQQSTGQNRSAATEAVEDILTRLCLEAGAEGSFFDLQSDHTPIRLPPKQFLLVVQTQFFQQAHYATDIFVQSRFRSNMERIYSRPFAPADEGWAICFKTIILLVLGSENLTQGNDPLFGSQFASSFLSTVRTALSNPRFLMAPKLINVQALALLSLAAQQYYPSGFAESILAQACLLAKTMGLHQTYAVQDGVSPAEAQERFNVFRSLYVQDKSFSISRGSICWLPSFDCSLSSELGQSASTGSNWAARIQLARMQEEVYRIVHSAGSQKQYSAKHRGALLRIEQSLEQWANTHDVFASPSTDASNVDLQLEFLATRISAFPGSSDPSHVRRTLNDSRASCAFLLSSYGKNDETTAGRLDAYLASKSPCEALRRNPSARSSKNRDSTSSHGARELTNEPVPLQLHTLLDAFSIPAFFILAKNSIWPASAHGESQAEEDLDLLQKVCACYTEYDMRIQTNNHTQKVGRAFKRLLEVVNLIGPPPQLHETRQSHNHRSPLDTHMIFGGSQGLSDSSSMSIPSTYAMPPLSLDGFSARRSTADAASTSTIPGLLTPAESQYTGQSYENLAQRPVSSYLHQQDMRPASRKRRLPSESDVWMDDDPDSRLLSDFLTAASDMSFDFTS